MSCYYIFDDLRGVSAQKSGDFRYFFRGPEGPVVFNDFLGRFLAEVCPKWTVLAILPTWTRRITRLALDREGRVDKLSGPAPCFSAAPCSFGLCFGSK
jgi:hypothetical protein